MGCLGVTFAMAGLTYTLQFITYLRKSKENHQVKFGKPNI